MFKHYISQRHEALRAACSGIGKTAVIYPAAALAGTSGGMTALGIVFFLNEVFKATPAQIGYVAATWSVAYVAGCLLLRPISVRLLPRYSMLLATSLSFLALSALLLAESLAYVFVSYAVVGVTLSLFWPPMMGWLSTNIEGKELGRTMGRFNLCWSCGLIVSPLLTGWLAEMDPKLPVRVSALVYLANACLILGAIMTLSGLGRDDGAHSLERQPAVAENRQGSFLRFPCWLALFAGFAVIGVIANVFPLSAQHDLGLSKSTVGVLFFERCLASAVVLGVLGRTSFWHFRSTQTTAGPILLGLLMLSLTLARSLFMLAVIFPWIGLCTATIYTNSLFHGVAGSTRRAARMAAHESLISAGLISGAALGGRLYQSCGFVVTYLVCALLMLATALGQAMLLLRVRSRSIPLDVPDAKQ